MFYNELVCVCVCLHTLDVDLATPFLSSTKFHAFYPMIFGQRPHKYSSSGQMLALSESDEKVTFTVFK
jgi:hypothetical protein